MPLLLFLKKKKRNILHEKQYIYTICEYGDLDKE